MHRFVVLRQPPFSWRYLLKMSLDSNAPGLLDCFILISRLMVLSYSSNALIELWTYWLIRRLSTASALLTNLHLSQVMQGQDPPLRLEERVQVALALTQPEANDARRVSCFVGNQRGLLSDGWQRPNPGRRATMPTNPWINLGDGLKAEALNGSFCSYLALVLKVHSTTPDLLVACLAFINCKK